MRSVARFGLALVALLGATIAAAQVSSQDYPARPVQFLIGFAPGGSSDLVSRIVAEQLAVRLGQPFVPVNRPAAGGVIANEIVARAVPDGYRLVLLTSGHPIAGVLFRKLPYHPVNDFAMVSVVTTYPFLITVPAGSPFKSLDQMLARARNEPGKVTYAIAGPASGHRLLGELLQIEAKVDMVGVTYKGAATAMTDLLGGRIDAMVETATFSLPQVRAGKLRALAVSTAKRYEPLPDVPAIAETVPGIDYTSWLGLATSPGTPRAIIDRLNRELLEILKTPAVQERLALLGGVASPSTPEQMRERIVNEMARWKRVIDIKNITVQ